MASFSFLVPFNVSPFSYSFFSFPQMPHFFLPRVTSTIQPEIGPGQPTVCPEEAR